MRGNIAIRISIAAALIVITYFGMWLVAWGIQLPQSVLPDWKLQDLPLQLGEWKGVDKQLDKRLFEAEEAQSVVEREYVNDSGQHIALHLAMFTDASKGIFHNPMSCYISNGWNSQGLQYIPLFEKGENPDKIAVCMWDKSGEGVVVGYWYQLGDIRLFHKWDMGIKVRWQMRGRKTWPVLIKILISTPSGMKPEIAKNELVNFAGLVHKWINQPDHREKDESTATASAHAK